MRSTTFIDIVDDRGIPLRATIIKAPNIDDVLVSEVQVQAFGVATGTDVSDRRVPREVRDFLLKFGVER